MELDAVTGPPALFGLTNKMKKNKTKTGSCTLGVAWIQTKAPNGSVPKEKVYGWMDRQRDGRDGRVSRSEAAGELSSDRGKADGYMREGCTHA